MSPIELENVYNDLSQVPQQTAEQAIGQLGQQQAAQGPSAAAMGTGGYGIGNYTYNRLVDPAVQQLSTQLVSTGRSQALNRAISLALSQAQENYRNAYNTYANRAASSGSGGGSGSGSGSGGGDGTITGVEEEEINTNWEENPNPETDVRLNYDENGNLISGSLPGTTQDFHMPSIIKQEIKDQMNANKRAELIAKWQKEHAFTPVPEWILNYGE